MKILGIDISSTTIGWAILEVDVINKSVKYINSGYIKPNKKINFIIDLKNIRAQLLSIMNNYCPDLIAIEDIIQYMQNKSTSKTIIKLTTYNRMICLLSYDYLNKLPNLYHIQSIRHGIKEKKIPPKKENIPALVSKYLNIKFPWEFKKTGDEKDENYDRADAIAVALYQSFILIEKANAPKQKSKKKKKKK